VTPITLGLGRSSLFPEFFDKVWFPPCFGLGGLSPLKKAQKNKFIR